jgi:D-alanyl-D-alanine carboxypeptidase
MRKPFLFLIAALAVAVLAAAKPAAAGYASLVIDAETGEILQAQDATTPWYPASLTKMMTVYLAFEKLAAGTLDLDEQLTVSSHAAGQQPTKLGLDPGEKITVKQAILATIVRSANDAAVVLAERMGGTEKYFAVLMTDKARDLGMAQTQFWNASGLPHEKQMTTARDMALLGQALLYNYPQYYHFFNTRSIKYNNRNLTTYNGILSSFPGSDGIKTGFTCGSGYNLVASAVREGRRLIGVVLGGKTRAGRNSEMVKLLSAAFGSEPVPEGESQLVIDLVPAVEGQGDGGPSRVLSSTECVATSSDPVIIKGSVKSKSAAVKPGTLPGWGIVFGSFPQEDKARSVVKQAQKSLKSVLKAGRAVVVERDWEGITSYRSVIVGLDRDQAGAACKHMWSTGAYCLALSPEALNSANTPWR